jgi:kumamolisin
VANDRVAISGSEVGRSGALRRTQAADPNQPIEATLVIRRPAGGKITANSGKSREEIEKQLAADPADVTAAVDFARQYGLSIVEQSPEKRIVRVAGTAQQMNAAFGIEMGQFEGPDGGRFLSYDGPLTVPRSASAAVTAVLGLNQQAVARSR